MVFCNFFTLPFLFPGEVCHGILEKSKWQPFSLHSTSESFIRFLGLEYYRVRIKTVKIFRSSYRTVRQWVRVRVKKQLDGHFTMISRLDSLKRRSWLENGPSTTRETELETDRAGGQARDWNEGQWCKESWSSYSHPSIPLKRQKVEVGNYWETGEVRDRERGTTAHPDRSFFLFFSFDNWWFEGP